MRGIRVEAFTTLVAALILKLCPNLNFVHLALKSSILMVIQTSNIVLLVYNVVTAQIIPIVQFYYPKLLVSKYIINSAHHLYQIILQ